MRTAVSIGQLERGRGEFWDRDLSDAFAWFTEGHETADLKKAQEMLKTVLA